MCPDLFTPHAKQEMKAFWLPSKTPEANILVDKPDMSTVCPASGKKLRLKDLIPVRFMRVPEAEDGYAMDPVTKDTFSNASRLVVLKATGETSSRFILSWGPLFMLS